jgi:hypothetical protein
LKLDLPGGIPKIPLGFPLVRRKSMRSRSLGIRSSFLSLQFLSVLAILLGVFNFSAPAQTKPLDLTGKWNLSWAARLGTEHDPIQLKQTDSKLTGTFLGHLGKPNVSGMVDGKNVTLRLEFAGAQPYTLVFTGTIDGDRMGGKFEIENLPNAYDSHGENATPSNYTWNAVRQPDLQPGDARPSR